MFRGSMTAIVTPFKDGRLDEKAYSELIEFQISNGTDGIVPCGTTGESATLTHDEHNRVVEIAIEVSHKRVPIIAGTGSNSTQEAVSLTRFALKAGAAGVLLITPYYNKPTQEGLYRHYKKIAMEVDIPIVLYNVPGRTSVNMLPETVERLAAIDNIVAVKEASGSLQQISDIIIRCGDRLNVISGDDFITLPILHIGGVGVISVTANIVPEGVAGMVDAFFSGNHEEALKIHNKLFNLHCAMFLETNPIPVKTGLHMMGKIEPEFRLPLSQMSGDNLDKLRLAMKEYGSLI